MPCSFATVCNPQQQLSLCHSGNICIEFTWDTSQKYRFLNDPRSTESESLKMKPSNLHFKHILQVILRHTQV